VILALPLLARDGVELAPGVGQQRRLVADTDDKLELCLAREIKLRQQKVADLLPMRAGRDVGQVSFLVRRGEITSSEGVQLVEHLLEVPRIIERELAGEVVEFMGEARISTLDSAVKSPHV